MPVLLWRCGTEAELNLAVGSNLHVCLSISSLLAILLLILLFSSYFRRMFRVEVPQLALLVLCKLQTADLSTLEPGSKEWRFGAVKNKTKKQNAGRRPERKPKQHENLGVLWNVSIDPVVALVFHVTFDVYFWVLTRKKQKGNKKTSNYNCAGFENHIYFLWGGTRSDGMWAGGVGWQVRQGWGRWQW